MNKAMRTSNSKARDYVNNLEAFIGSNIYSNWFSWDEGMTKLYAIFSYGEHFPMYIYDDNEDVWVGNQDKYSRSTTRHQSQARPSGGVDVWLSTSEMKGLIAEGGLVGLTISKAQN